MTGITVTRIGELCSALTVLARIAGATLRQIAVTDIRANRIRASRARLRVNGTSHTIIARRTNDIVLRALILTIVARFTRQATRLSNLFLVGARRTRDRSNAAVNCVVTGRCLILCRQRSASRTIVASCTLARRRRVIRAGAVIARITSEAIQCRAAACVIVVRAQGASRRIR